MNSEDENNTVPDEEASGSDELLASDELRLPEGANILVRLHALRAWLERRRAESELEIGSAALVLRETMSEMESEPRPRRRLAANTLPLARAQLSLSHAQQRLSAYDEARSLLEDCVAHTTTGSRLLVEYYLSLEELVEAADVHANSPWLLAMQDVLHRVEQVGTPGDAME